MKLPVVSLAAAAVLLTATAARANDPSGVWQAGNGDAHIRVAKCGPGYCGTIVWLKRPLDPDTGKPLLDKQNPDRGKRVRPVMGLQIIGAMMPNGPNRYSGPIYNADDGNTYNGHMYPGDGKTLKVEGCLGNFCQAEDWPKVSN